MMKSDPGRMPQGKKVKILLWSNDYWFCFISILSHCGQTFCNTILRTTRFLFACVFIHAWNSLFLSLLLLEGFLWFLKQWPPRSWSTPDPFVLAHPGNGFMLTSWLVSAAGAFSLWPARNWQYLLFGLKFSERVFLPWETISHQYSSVSFSFWYDWDLVIISKLFVGNIECL